jgi:hypothetical protein
MRGRYERSPEFRLLKTDIFAVMFYGFYAGMIEANSKITLYGAAKIFVEKYDHCDLDETAMVNGHQRLSHIVKDMKK